MDLDCTMIGCPFTEILNNAMRLYLYMWQMIMFIEENIM